MVSFGDIMSGWNYRVVRHREKDQLKRKKWVYWFSIHEAYYDDHGKIWATTDACSPHGESLKELKTDFAYFMGAFSKPVLDEWKLPQKGAKGPGNVKEKKHGERIRGHSGRLRGVWSRCRSREDHE